MASDPEWREVASNYYPPRRRWHGFWRPWANRTRVGLDAWRRMEPGEFGVFAIAVAVLVPGAAWVACGRLGLAAAALAGYALGVWLFADALDSRLVAVGMFAFYPAYLYYGLLIALHAAGIMYLVRHWVRESPFLARLRLAVGITAAVFCMVYLPLLSVGRKYLVDTLNLEGKTIVLDRTIRAADVRRGQSLVYHLPRLDDDQVRFETGYGMGPVLACAGDQVDFAPGQVRINGKVQPALDWMPERGECKVPKNHWFVWPNLRMTQRGRVPANELADVLLRVAMVSETQFVGGTFPTWFGRKQPQSLR